MSPSPPPPGSSSSQIAGLLSRALADVEDLTHQLDAALRRAKKAERALAAAASSSNTSPPAPSDPSYVAFLDAEHRAENAEKQRDDFEHRLRAIAEAWAETDRYIAMADVRATDARALFGRCFSELGRGELVLQPLPPFPGFSPLQQAHTYAQQQHQQSHHQRQRRTSSRLPTASQPHVQHMQPPPPHNIPPHLPGPPSVHHAHHLHPQVLPPYPQQQQHVPHPAPFPSLPPAPLTNVRHHPSDVETNNRIRMRSPVDTDMRAAKRVKSDKEPKEREREHRAERARFSDSLSPRLPVGTAIKNDLNALSAPNSPSRPSPVYAQNQRAPGALASSTENHHRLNGKFTPSDNPDDEVDELLDDAVSPATERKRGGGHEEADMDIDDMILAATAEPRQRENRVRRTSESDTSERSGAGPASASAAGVPGGQMIGRERVSPSVLAPAGSFVRQQQQMMPRLQQQQQGGPHPLQQQQQVLSRQNTLTSLGPGQPTMHPQQQQHLSHPQHAHPHAHVPGHGTGGGGKRALPLGSLNAAGQRTCRQCGMPGRYKDGKCVEKWGPGPEGPGTVCDRCRKKMKRVERRGTQESLSMVSLGNNASGVFGAGQREGLGVSQGQGREREYHSGPAPVGASGSVGSLDPAHRERLAYTERERERDYHSHHHAAAFGQQSQTQQQTQPTQIQSQNPLHQGGASISYVRPTPQGSTWDALPSSSPKHNGRKDREFSSVSRSVSPDDAPVPTLPRKDRDREREKNGAAPRHATYPNGTAPTARGSIDTDVTPTSATAAGIPSSMRLPPVPTLDGSSKPVPRPSSDNHSNGGGAHAAAGVVVAAPENGNGNGARGSRKDSLESLTNSGDLDGRTGTDLDADAEADGDADADADEEGDGEGAEKEGRASTSSDWMSVKMEDGGAAVAA